MDEFLQLRNRYPNIVFGGYDSKILNKNKFFFLIECYSILPSNYNIDFLKQFKGIITWSDWFKEKYKNELNILKVNGFPLFNSNNNLKEFKTFKEKINGVCLICRHRSEGTEGSIVNKRFEVINNLDKSNRLICHCYGKLEYGEEMYKGVIGNSVEETFPSSLAKLKKLNEYKFNIAFENCYHPEYSIDYITEKLRDCMRARTVGIYLGAYNIQDIIPKELYIDYREFKNDYELSTYLKNMPEDIYNNMVEDAYIWDRNSRLGNIEDLKRELDKL